MIPPYFKYTSNLPLENLQAPILIETTPLQPSSDQSPHTPNSTSSQYLQYSTQKYVDNENDNLNELNPLKRNRKEKTNYQDKLLYLNMKLQIFIIQDQLHKIYY